jgi:hypothetical protein
MKGQVSRISQDRTKRYSAVFQNQGAMVTDADLGEASFIARSRTDELGNEAVGGGAPADGGAVVVTTTAGNDLAALRPGLVYADGVRGTVRLRAGETLNADAIDLYAKQEDFPRAPARPASSQVVYADVWHQDRFPLTDPGLVDPGFHGAETSFRSRTMAQIKLAPLGDRWLIGNQIGPYPRKGDALIRAAIRTGAAAIDPCDPCATETPESHRLGNALFRVEVLAATGPAESVEQVTIAWSLENAAEQMATSPTPPSAFTGRVGSVFEYFSEITEAHKGAFADPTTRRHSGLENAYVDPAPARTDGGPAGAWPFVRRWDGYAVLDLTGPSPSATTIRNGAFDLDGGRARITLDNLVFQLELTNKRVLVGDYWLVEVREFAAAADRVKAVSDLPIGIEHHYAALFTIDNTGACIPLTDADRRAATFPSLDNLPADHVGYENGCPRLYGPEPRLNVQEALDALCDINAAKIPFDNNCSHIFDSATNVQEALDALCGLDLSPRLGYRLLFDWGVVCGIDLAKVDDNILDGRVVIKPGAFLDRSGNLAQLNEEIEVNILTGQNIEIVPDIHAPQGQTEYCLALLYNPDQSITVHLVDKADCWWPEDLTYNERLEACKKEKEGIKGLFEGIVAEEKTLARDKFILAATSEEPLARSYRMTQAEEGEIGLMLDKLQEGLKPKLNESKVAWLDTALAEVETDHDPATAGPAAAEFKRGARAIGKMKVIAEGFRLAAEICECRHYLPDCPTRVTPPKRALVPIACVTLSLKGRVLQEVCRFCCRRQALTPRTWRYWYGDLHHAMMGNLRKSCCFKLGFFAPEEPHEPGNSFVPWKPIDEIELIPNKPRWPGGPWGPPPGLTNPPGPGPIIWSDNPDIVDLGEGPAIQVMQGHGVDVTEIIDLDEGDALATLAQKGGVNSRQRMASGGAVNPGDKVALLMQDGVSRGYVVLERGDGRYLFATSGDKVKPQFDMSGVEGALSEAETAKSAIVTDLTNLEGRRDSLAGEVEGLKAQVDGMRKAQEEVSAKVVAAAESKTRLDREIAVLAAERERLAGGVVELQALFKEVKGEGDRMLAEFEKVRDQFQDLAVERDKLAISVTSAQPVLTLLGSQPALVETLNAEGVGTLGEFNAMPEADRTRAFEKAGVPAAERKRILANLDRRMKTPG